MPGSGKNFRKAHTFKHVVNSATGAFWFGMCIVLETFVTCFLSLLARKKRGGGRVSPSTD